MLKRSKHAKARNVTNTQFRDFLSIKLDRTLIDGVALFNGLNPGLANSKFRNLSNVRANSRKFANFVALEDRLNDGVPLAGPVARECLFDW